MSNNQSPENPNKVGRLFIISAPSGAGKTSLIKSVVESNPNLIVSISHTTRKPRVGERDELDYFFISKNEFLRMAKNNEFLEEALVFDHHYGTSVNFVKTNLQLKKNIILEIDWQGARSIQQVGLKNISIFILPPSLHELERRLKDRGDDPKIVQRRMRDAINEITHYGEYDYLIINDDFKEATDTLTSIINQPSYQMEDQNPKLKRLLAELMPK
ncbi:MAG: guanylate kinase [Gammaproteobacteria bacterium]